MLVHSAFQKQGILTTKYSFTAHSLQLAYKILRKLACIYPTFDEIVIFLSIPVTIIQKKRSKVFIMNEEIVYKAWTANYITWRTTHLSEGEFSLRCACPVQMIERVFLITESFHS